jgi:hypothetical protein
MSQLRVSSVTDLSGAGSTYAPGHVVQVVQAVKTDVFTMSSGTFADITGLSVSITPSSATSKILVLGSLNIGNDNDAIVAINLVRGSTSIGQGDGLGSRTRAIAGPRPNSSFQILSNTVNFLDSPETTSSTIYKFQMKTSSGTSHLNRSHNDSDLSGLVRTSSSITLMEIAQ